MSAQRPSNTRRPKKRGPGLPGFGVSGVEELEEAAVRQQAPDLGILHRRHHVTSATSRVYGFFSSLRLKGSGGSFRKRFSSMMMLWEISPVGGEETLKGEAENGGLVNEGYLLRQPALQRFSTPTLGSCPQDRLGKDRPSSLVPLTRCMKRNHKRTEETPGDTLNVEEGGEGGGEGGLFGLSEVATFLTSKTTSLQSLLVLPDSFGGAGGRGGENRLNPLNPETRNLAATLHPRAQTLNLKP